MQKHMRLLKSPENTTGDRFWVEASTAHTSCHGVPAFPALTKSRGAISCLVASPGC